MAQKVCQHLPLTVVGTRKTHQVSDKAAGHPGGTVVTTGRAVRGVKVVRDGACKATSTVAGWSGQSRVPRATPDNHLGVRRPLYLLWQMSPGIGLSTQVTAIVPSEGLPDCLGLFRGTDTSACHRRWGLSPITPVSRKAGLMQSLSFVTPGGQQVRQGEEKEGDDGAVPGDRAVIMLRFLLMLRAP